MPNLAKLELFPEVASEVTSEVIRQVASEAALKPAGIFERFQMMMISTS